MTEQEWLTSTDPAAMLRFVTDGLLREGPVVWQASDRKLRLFACACCRLWGTKRGTPSVYDLLEHRGHRSPTVETDFEWAMAWTVKTLEHTIDWSVQAAILRDIVGNPFRPVKIDTRYLIEGREAGSDGRKFHADHWPNDEYTFRPDWSQSPTVLRIAQSIYDERAFERMPILGDALEEAGCTEEAVLKHCRGWEPVFAMPIEDPCPVCGRVQGCDHTSAERGDDKIYWRLLSGPHVRGCWVLDLILGKE